jgi:hypothetical protein
VQKYEEGTNRVGAARLQQIAKMLGVECRFSTMVTARNQTSKACSSSTALSVRVLRAYTAIKNRSVQIQLVSLVETIAASQR